MSTPVGEQPLPKVSWALKTLELRTQGRNVLRGRHAWQIHIVINCRPETNVPTVEGRVDPELASTVTYGLLVKTMFMEDDLTRLRVIAKEEEEWAREALPHKTQCDQVA